MSVEITAGSTCQGKLGKREHADSLLGGDRGQLQSGRKVIGNVSHANRRRGGRHFNESVIHTYSFLPQTWLTLHANMHDRSEKRDVSIHFIIA